MVKENDDSFWDERLRRLMAEVDGSVKVTSKSAADKGKSGFLASLILASGFVGAGFIVGFWKGYHQATLRFSSQTSSESQVLAAQGWRQDGTGVFYRWCRDDCHVPRLYGGGVLQVFEVKCVERPCGDLTMRFNVLDAKRQVVEQVSRKETGMQGETRRFYVESQNPEAASIELADFLARARV